MTAADHALLARVTKALNVDPFAGSVNVDGLTLSRPAARAIERNLLRLKGTRHDNA